MYGKILEMVRLQGGPDSRFNNVTTVCLERSHSMTKSFLSYLNTCCFSWC